jgi:hypothetical protein
MIVNINQLISQVVAIVTQIVGLALLALAAAVVCLASPASAYDYDDKWIGQTIHLQHRKAWLDARKHVKPRHYHKPKPQPTHPDTRVYGMISRGPQRVYRDATSHVECWPPIEAISGEHASEDRAWNDAQLQWMGAVAVKYGARFADIQSVDARTLRRQCFRTSFNDSWAGRNVEAAKQAMGLTGFKLRCVIVASPCMAPATGDTPLKGDQK